MSKISSQSDANYSNILFVSSKVANAQEIASQTTPNTKVVILDAEKDAVQQIAETLEDYRDLASVQIFSHGSEGQLDIGVAGLNSNNIEQYSEQLKQWGESLSEDGDLLLLGCNVAAGDKGKDFVRYLSELTSADVAASEDLTGSEDLDGDWDLEFATGLIDAPLGFQMEVLNAYTSVLGTYRANADDSGSGSLRSQIDKANSNPDTDVIYLPSTPINLESSLPDITSNISFVGGNNSKIDGQNLHQIVTVDGEDITVTFNNITFAQGLANGGNGIKGGGGGLGAGGAIFIEEGTVVTNNVVFDSNKAQGGNGGPGAGGGRGGKRDGDDPANGTTGGSGGGLNEETGASGGTGGEGNYHQTGRKGGDGSNGSFGEGGGGGAGGGGGDGWRDGGFFSGYIYDARHGGDGGTGGTGGFGGGGGAGGGAGGGGDADYRTDNGIVHGLQRHGGYGSQGGEFAGAGTNGGGDNTKYTRDPGLGGTGGGGAGLGGAIFVNENGQLKVVNTKFNNNSAKGGSGGNNGSSSGAGIFINEVDNPQKTQFQQFNQPQYSNNAADQNSNHNHNGNVSSFTLPSISNIVPKNGSEGEESGKFTINLSSPAPFDYYIGYSVSGTATGDDFWGTGDRSVLIREGQQSADINIYVKDDIYFEPDETVTITLNSNTPNRNIGSKTLTIKDNEPEAYIKNSDNTVSLNEDSSKDAEFTIGFGNPKNLSENRPAPQEFPLYLEIINENDTVRGTFTNTQKGSDYKLFWEAKGVKDGQDNTFLKNGAVTTSPVSNTKDNNLNIYEISNLPEGTTSVTIRVEPVDDEIYEKLPESVTVNLKEYTEVYGGTAKRYYAKDNGASGIKVNLIDNEPIVSLGKVVNPTEGFGFGSTIQGLDDALVLNGNNYVETDLSFDGIKQFTQEAWIFSNVADNEEYGILSTSYEWSNSPQLSLVNKTGIRFGVDRYDKKNVDDVLVKDAWNHVATTYDGNEYIVYVNGQQVASTKEWTGIEPRGNLEIGYDRNSYSSKKFKGAIDEVRLWNVARTQEEIQSSLLTNPLLSEEFDPENPELIGYWRFNQDLTNSAKPKDDSNKLEADSTKLEADSTQPKTGDGQIKGTNNPAYINNPTPQIGYVEVDLKDINGEPKAFTGAQGLWVEYEITGGTAVEKTDFFSSQTRRVTNLPKTQRHNIIIGEGETKGRIYFSALSDAIVEGDETVEIKLLENNFDIFDKNNDGEIERGEYPDTFDSNKNGRLDEEERAKFKSNYGISSSAGSKTIIIKDNQRYQPGVTLLDSFGEEINADNPLTIDAGNDAEFQVKLTSQPTSNVSLKLSSDVSSLNLTVTFTPDNWDKPQILKAYDIDTGSSGNISIATSDSNDSNYQNINRSLPIKGEISRKLRVTEGDINRQSVIPEVSIIALNDAREGDSETEPGKFAIELSAPAPEGGLTVEYSIDNQSTAKLDEDYTLPVNSNTTITIAPGETRAILAITSQNNDTEEGARTVKVNLESGNSYDLKDSHKSATLNIIDDDRAGLEIGNSEIEYSLQFDGVDDFVSIPNPELTKELTFETWLYVNSFDDSQSSLVILGDSDEFFDKGAIFFATISKNNILASTGYSDTSHRFLSTPETPFPHNNGFI